MGVESGRRAALSLKRLSIQEARPTPITLNPNQTGVYSQQSDRASLLAVSSFTKQRTKNAALQSNVSDFIRYEAWAMAPPLHVD